VIFVSSSTRMRESYLKLCHDCFLPNTFPSIIINLLPYHRRYAVQLLKRRRKINYLPTNKPSSLYKCKKLVLICWSCKNLIVLQIANVYWLG
jgi:hypothetical protein